MSRSDKYIHIGNNFYFHFTVASYCEVEEPHSIMTTEQTTQLQLGSTFQVLNSELYICIVDTYKH